MARRCCSVGIFGEILLSLLCVFGLSLAGWWLMGRLLRPIPQTCLYALIPVKGEGEGMEQGVRMLVWLRSLGLLNCPILLADVGLSPEGREVALRLICRWPDVVLWPAEDLGTYMFYS